MFRKLFYLIILVSYCGLVNNKISRKKADLKRFFFNLPLSKENNNRNCSISRSNIVRNVLLQDFLPIYAKYSSDVPNNCPFKLEKSFYHTLENNKIAQSSGFWKCNNCGKLFYSEEFIYRHMEKKHYNEVFNGGSKAVCLADYCDIFRCDLHEKYPIVRQDFPECNSKQVRKIQRKCETLINRCLPNNRLRHHIYDALQKSLCKSLDCESFYAPFEDYSLKTVVLLAFSVPLILVILYSFLSYCWDIFMEDDKEESWYEFEKKCQERIKIQRDAQLASLRNKGIKYRYNGISSVRRR